ncbi:MAG: hypothetical protein ACYC24_00045 [Desulfobacteria bacterium]
MKKLLVRTMLLAFVITFPVPTMAEVNVGVSISLPPLIVFASPPEMVVIPETYVYVVPDSREDIFFYDGWWWRPWEGRWYRSRHYDSGWGYYQRVPSFYRSVPSGWRNDYREHRWGGQPWNYQRIPHQQVQRNWSTWKKDKHWEKQQTWGVQGLKPRTQPKQQPRGVAKPQQSRPKSQEAARPQQSRPKSQEAARPQQSRPKSQEAAKPQQSRPQPQQREVQQQRSQPQQREAPKQQSKPQRGKPDKGQGKPDKGQEDRQDRR